MRTKSYTVAATAPDSRGEFQGTIFANDLAGDRDGERIEQFKNAPTVVPLHLEHRGQPIGTASILPKDDGTLIVLGKLYLNNASARKVHERMLLPKSDWTALAGMSVGFGYDSDTAYRKDGVTVIPSATLREVSLCRSADARQRTLVSSVKSRTSADALSWKVAKVLADAGVTPQDSDFRDKALAAIKKIRPTTRFKSSPEKWAEPFWHHVDTSDMEPRHKQQLLREFAPEYAKGTVASLARRLKDICADFGYPELGDSMHRLAESFSVDTDRQAMMFLVRERIENYAADHPDSGPLLDRETKNRLTDAVRPMHVTKHSAHAEDAGADACRHAADVADAAREQFTALPQQRALQQVAVQLRGVADRLVGTEGPDLVRERAANNALQCAEAMRLVAEFLRAGDHGDVADRLERAADRVTAACEPLAAHRLDPPPAPDHGTEAHPDDEPPPPRDRHGPRAGARHR